MPMYTYRCEDCKEEFEEFNTIVDRGKQKCIKCESDNVIRVPGAPNTTHMGEHQQFKPQSMDNKLAGLREGLDKKKAAM